MNSISYNYYHNAIVRKIPDSYKNCHLLNIPPKNIDVDLARVQHQKYCDILNTLGLNLLFIDADELLPDCTFVEDSAIIFDDIAIICNIKTPSRKNEKKDVKEILKKYKTLKEIHSPGFIEGGDVLKIENKVYVGISSCTNMAGYNQLTNFIKGRGYILVPVEINKSYHLKSSCSYIGKNYVIISSGHFDLEIFSEYNILEIPEDESFFSNCLSINNVLLVPKGYNKSITKINNAGFHTVELDISEFEKAEGSLTCLSILF